jgi:hypothetical protein
VCEQTAIRGAQPADSGVDNAEDRSATHVLTCTNTNPRVCSGKSRQIKTQERNNQERGCHFRRVASAGCVDLFCRQPNRAKLAVQRTNLAAKATGESKPLEAALSPGCCALGLT